MSWINVKPQKCNLPKKKKIIFSHIFYKLMTLLHVGFPIFVDVLKYSLYFSSFKLIMYRLFLLLIVVYLSNNQPLEYYQFLIPCVIFVNMFWSLLITLKTNFEFIAHELH